MVDWYNDLKSVDVTDKIEQKNGLNYLSWMYAWQELKKRYPLSYSTVHETPDGMLVWRDPVGCHVKTSVSVVWEEEDGLHEHTATEYLPVMDFKNKPVPYESADSMAINKTIQRSLTKCIARLGLGGYIYAGEDMPEESEDEKRAKAEEEMRKAQELANVIGDIDTEVKRITKSMKADEKKEFASQMILPVIGQMNYKTCRNVDQLQDLLTKMKAA